jgi:hypothetical protein
MADRKLRQRTGCSLNFTELDFAIAMLIRATLFARGQLVERIVRNPAFCRGACLPRRPERAPLSAG